MAESPSQLPNELMSANPHRGGIPSTYAYQKKPTDFMEEGRHHRKLDAYLPNMDPTLAFTNGLRPRAQ